MKKSRVIIMTLVAIMLFSSVFVNANEATNIKISLNGVPLDIPASYGKPFIDNQSRTIIPLRIISERLGHKVEWDNKNQIATIDKDVFITIGDKIVYGPGSQNNPNGIIQMDTFAILKDSRTYVPLRFVVEALGYEVSYDGPNRANGYQHMVDISGTPKTPVEPGEPVQEGNVHTIKGENGTVELDLDNDVNRYGGIIDERSYELVELLHKSIKLTETSNNVKVEFLQPQLPNGLRYDLSITAITNDGAQFGIYDASTQESRFWKLRSDGYIEVNYNETPMSEIKHIVLSGQVLYGTKGTQQYKADLRTGKVALGNHEFLFD